jgi:hypothetical protein
MPPADGHAVGCADVGKVDREPEASLHLLDEAGQATVEAGGAAVLGVVDGDDSQRLAE